MKTTTLVTLEAITCANCGVVFGIEEGHVKRLRSNGATFYCPNGHSNWYGESAATKLAKQLAEAEKKANLYQGYYQAEQSDHEYTRNRLNGTKGALTKLKKRVSEGTCPCCQKSFKVLAKHMAEKHPEYQNEDTD